MTAKKDSEKCPGCGEALIQNINTERNKLCACWEAKMPKKSKASIAALSVTNLDKPPKPPNPKRKSAGQTEVRRIQPPSRLHVPEHKLVQRLKECGLSEAEVEMVLLRFWDAKKNSEIAELYGITDHRRASEALKKIFKKLKAAGFTLTDGDC